MFFISLTYGNALYVQSNGVCCTSLSDHLLIVYKIHDVPGFNASVLDFGSIKASNLETGVGFSGQTHFTGILVVCC